MGLYGITSYVSDEILKFIKSYPRIHYMTILLFLQGYLFISVLVSANSDLMRLIIQNIKNDMANRNPVHVNLALQCIANIGNTEMVEAFNQEIPKLLISGETTDNVKQCAALCLLHLFRLKKDILHQNDWTSRIVQLLNDKHLVCDDIIIRFSV